MRAMSLRRLLDLVRYGDAERSADQISTQHLADAIDEEIAETDPEVGRQGLDRLRFLALRAEARYSFGHRKRASDAADLWNESRDLREEFGRWSKGERNQLDYTYDELKAILWVLMSAFFYHAFMIGFV